MSLEWAVVQGFMEAHPKEAARSLELLSEEQMSALLAEASPEATASVLQQMEISVATRQLEHPAASQAAALLAALPLDRASNLARRLTPEKLESVLSEMPPEGRQFLERLLQFPENSAGALMEPRVVSYHEDRRASDLLSQVRRAGIELRYYVYVVSDENELVGVLSLRELVAAPSDATLGTLMRRPVQSLSARASRRAILRHPAWKRFPVLPVVDERGRLLGIFRYETFQNLQRSPVEAHEPSPLGLALALGELFWLGASGLFRGLGETRQDES